MSFQRLAGLVGLAAAALLAVDPTAAHDLVLAPLTSDAANDVEPRISIGSAGPVVVWKKGTGSAAEIWYRRSAGATRLTNDALEDTDPDVSGDVIVWQRFDNADYEIVLRDLDAPGNVTLTSNGLPDLAPRISNGNVCFQRDSGALDLFLYPDPGVSSPITGGGDDGSHVLSDDNVAWVKGEDTTAEVWAWYPNLPAPGAYQITANSVPDTAPAISGQRIVWVRGTGGAAEIWRHDPLATTPTRQVTNDGLEDAAPAIDGERLVWQGFDNDDFEIWTAHTDGGPQQLSTNEWNDLAPQVAGSHVVWTADEPGDAEIWISWDGGPPEPLTDNAVDDVNPRVAGDYVVWEQCTDLGGPSESCDIWMAPEPAGAAIGAAAWGALAALGARRRGRERG